MNAEAIAHELHGRRSGVGWVARCPAHDDRTPSLSIDERDGKILIHCFSGCEQRAVIAALTARGLWPEREQHELTPAERREWGRRRREAEQAAERVYNWYTGAALRLADMKVDADLEGDIEGLAVASRALYELEQAGPAELARMYRDAEPGLRARDEGAGRRWRALCENLAARVVTAARPGKVGQDGDSIAV